MVLKTQGTDKVERFKRVNQVHNSVKFRLATEFVLLVIMALIYFYLNSQCWFGLFPLSSIKIVSLYEKKNGVLYHLPGPGLIWKPVTKDGKPKLGVTLSLKNKCYCSDSNIYVQMKNESSQEGISSSSGTLEFVSRNGDEITWEGDWTKPVTSGNYQVQIEILCLDSKEHSRTHFFSFIFAEIPVE
jgi:hypothetical protein